MTLPPGPGGMMAYPDPPVSGGICLDRQLSSSLREIPQMYLRKTTGHYQRRRRLWPVSTWANRRNPLKTNIGVYFIADKGYALFLLFGKCPLAWSSGVAGNRLDRN